jgi:predicted MFS family arabinose efflux permease
VLFLMLATFIQGLFFIYGFYSWQKYFLDLLHHNLVWVSGVIAALIGLTQILGNALVKPILTRFKNRANILITFILLQSVVIIGAALTTNFFVAVGLYLVFTVSFGCMMPIKASWLNSRIPSEQRATLISLDSNFSDIGGTIGQLGLGYISQAISIPFAWLLGGATQLIGAPLISLAKHHEEADE